MLIEQRDYGLNSQRESGRVSTRWIWVKNPIKRTLPDMSKCAIEPGINRVYTPTGSDRVIDSDLKGADVRHKGRIEAT